MLQQAQQLKYLIKEMHDCCQDRMLFESNKFNLPQAELKCLMLFVGERNLTAKHIANKMDVAKSRVTKIIDGLIRKGYVTSTHDQNDARIKLLNITPSGQRKLEEVESFILEIHKRLLFQIEPNERENVLKYLETLRQSMDNVKVTLV
ncbi:MAG: MarR family transcriptional regulator [Spirochaetota bacterium]|nr:MarR family transcriptional regulator [Spirochaetota bacterium]